MRVNLKEIVFEFLKEIVLEIMILNFIEFLHFEFH